MKPLVPLIAALAWSLIALTGASAQVVLLETAKDGINAHYLDTKATQFIFADPQLERSDWDLSGLTPSQSALTAPADFTLSLRPDTTEAGRGYISLARVGDGYVIYGPALTEANKTLSLSFDVPASWSVWPEDRTDGYIYLGPSYYITAQQGHAVIAAREVSPQLKTMVSTAFADGLRFYEAHFGPLPYPPSLILTTEGAGPSTLRADVTDTGVISVRLNGDSWIAPSEDALAQLNTVIFHEAAHLWNSHLALPTEGTPWLHEGGAQYLALIAAVSTGHMTEASANDALGAHLADCRKRLGSHAEVDRQIGSGSAVYDCGVLIQWLADLELRQATGGAFGVLEQWGQMIREAPDGQPHYGPKVFRAALAEDSAVTQVFEGSTETRWSMIEARLKALGVDWENQPSKQDYLMSSLFHLNSQNCDPGSSTGFYIRDAYVQMDNGPTCGSLSNDTAIGEIEGLDPLKDPRALFEAVQARCAALETVEIKRRGETQALSARCQQPLIAPFAYAITQAPSLKPNASSPKIHLP